MSATRSRAGWLASPPPSAAIEVGARRVTAVALGTAAGRPVVSAHATERLADGLVAPGLTTTNLPDRKEVAAAVGRVIQGLGVRLRRVALVLPDGAAKVSLVKFDKAPERDADLEQLIRWQVKKAMPFPLEQAQISWTRGVDAGGGPEYVVTVARRDIVAEYEGVCTAAGLYPGLVDIATFNIANAVLATDALSGAASSGAAASDTAPSGNGGGDWLLVHVAPDSTTLAVLRGGALLLFRNRAAEGEGSLADFVHQTAMYYEDRLGGRGLTRALITPRDLTPAAHDEVTEVARSLEARGLTRVAEVDVRGAATLADRISPAPDLLRALAAPVGALLRDRVA